MQAKTITFIDTGYHDADMKTGRPPQIEQSAFGRRLQSLRESANLTQREVAGTLGISQPSYAAWERRGVALNAEQLAKLAEIFGVEVADLFRDDENGVKRTGPVGRARKTFEAVSELPRSRQKKILDVVDVLLTKAS